MRIPDETSRRPHLIPARSSFHVDECHGLVEIDIGPQSRLCAGGLSAYSMMMIIIEGRAALTR